MTTMLKNCFISVAVISVVFSLDFQQRCSQYTHSFYLGSSCFVGENKTVTYVTAKGSCNHMEKGHLAFIGSQQTMDKLAALVDVIAPPSRLPWIGLEQNDPTTAVEPAGSWSWTHPDGRFWTPITHLIIPWNVGEPNNQQNDMHGCMGGQSSKAVFDCVNAGQTGEYICEYENVEKKYKQHATNTIGNNMTKMQETVESNKRNCAIQCSIQLPCRAFSYNENTGSCVLHYLPSNGFAGFEPEDQQGYTMFDTYY